MTINISIEIFSKQFESTALEIIQLESRQTKNKNWKFLQVNFIKIPV